MTAPALQLAFVPEDRDDLEAAERAGVEANVAADDLERKRGAWPAPTCRCARPWGTRGHCIRCGRDVEARP
jgi:hypothetical protein